MKKKDVLKILKNNLNFSEISIHKIDKFQKFLIDYNKSYNLISESTEKEVWTRHILDSAQIVNLINFKDHYSLSDLGSGAGFPGLVIAAFNTNSQFHVKLYEKSTIKCNFLRESCKKFNISAEVFDGNYIDHKIESEYLVCRAFKKLDKVIDISREIARFKHKLIILKGRKAKEEIESLSKKLEYKYELIKSITDQKSRILVIDVKK